VKHKNKLGEWINLRGDKDGARGREQQEKGEENVIKSFGELSFR